MYFLLSIKFYPVGMIKMSSTQILDIISVFQRNIWSITNTIPILMRRIDGFGLVFRKLPADSCSFKVDGHHAAGHRRKSRTNEL